MPSSFRALRRRLAAATVLAALGGVTALPASAQPESPEASPTEAYIVVLDDDVARPGAVAAEHRAAHGAQVQHTYSAALKGYSARLSARGYAAVVSDPRVQYVERDGVAHTTTTQSGATWGIDRADQRGLPLSGTYSYTRTGTGVRAYVIDTGIRFSHAEFGGRAVSGFDAVDGGSATDCNGHGTHVAGTIGGTRYGVAKDVALVGVRVLGCDGSGSLSGVIAGIDWVTANHVKPAVANMSLGGGASTSLDTAVKNSIARGVAYAVAGGNGNMAGIAQDACKSSPARVPQAMTIGATDRTDRKTSWSNYGACVDWFAPGAGITAAWHTGDAATNTISGTSMATPHVAGVAALYLQGSPDASPSGVRDALYAATTKGIVTSSRTGNNHLLHTSY